MKRIAIDMDEVMADTALRVIDLYERDFRRRIGPEELHGKNISDAVPAAHLPRIREYLHSGGFFRDLPVMPDSQEVIRELSAHYEIFIATAAMEFRTCFTDKFDWLADHFPFIPWQNIVFCGDKSIIQADFLIDDRARHFEGFRGQGILYSGFHNVHETRYPRVNSWKEVRQLFLGPDGAKL